jgi:dipeptidase D
MAVNVKDLAPQALWRNFDALNAVPRASKKEEAVIAFAKQFGEQLGFPTFVDEVGNVIIKKPATAGMEDRTTVVLQSHLDMVHQKNADTNFDFDTQGIQMYIDGDWVKAKGTTLGADNGIGVATIMGLLESTDIPHPPLEALFTIDEETGMTGAMGLKGGLLDAGIMLNLDTEDDDELTIGCAGGIDITATGTYEEVVVENRNKTYRVAVKGGAGGHSGMDIHKGIANANKLLNRFLYELEKKTTIQLCSFEGGSLRNAIPREAFAVLAVGSPDDFEQVLEALNTTYALEYATTDPSLTLVAEPVATPEKVMHATIQKQLMQAVYACPNGIYRMSPDIAGLVQTSNNLARIAVGAGKYEVLCLTRGSVDSEKMDEANSIKALFELIGADVELSGDYPGWAPRPGAGIVDLMHKLYRESFNEEPRVNACHAGLECGILGTHYPEMEMISFGPNIRGAHSPDEKVQISSVQKFWGYLLDTLKLIP